jgi:hypothetical protein
MSNESLGLTGQVHMVLRDRYGFVKEERFGPNLVVTDGKEEVARLISYTSNSGDDFTHIAIGTDNTIPDAADTTLGAEITSAGGERTTGYVSIETQTVTNDTCQFVTTYNFTASFSVQESGVFNHTSTGDMLCRQTFTALSVSSADALTVTWKIRVG